MLWNKSRMKKKNPYEEYEGHNGSDEVVEIVPVRPVATPHESEQSTFLPSSSPPDAVEIAKTPNSRINTSSLPEVHNDTVEPENAFETQRLRRSPVVISSETKNRIVKKKRQQMDAARKQLESIHNIMNA